MPEGYASRVIDLLTNNGNAAASAGLAKAKIAAHTIGQLARIGLDALDTASDPGAYMLAKPYGGWAPRPDHPAQFASKDPGPAQMSGYGPRDVDLPASLSEASTGNAPSSHQVGEVVNVKGRNWRVAAIHPDGSMTLSAQ